MTDVVSTRLPPCEEHAPEVFVSAMAQVQVVGRLQLVLQLLVAGLLVVPQVQLLLVQQRTVDSRPPAFKKARRTVVPTQNENAVGHFCMLYFQCSNMLFAARFVDEVSLPTVGPSQVIFVKSAYLGPDCGQAITLSVMG